MPFETKSEPPGDEADAVETIAADWMIRRDRGLTAGEADELARWLDADRRHARVFRALEFTWELMGEMRTAPAKIVHVTPWFGRARWLPPTLAAAAAVALGLLWSSGRIRLPVGPDQAFATSATTKVGAWRELTLPDRSVVQINTDSEVHVEFTRAERRVRLERGEAHFTVAKNPARPFIVVAGNVELRAVGTAFNVRMREAAVEVLVTEGAVKVRSPETQPSVESDRESSAQSRVPVEVSESASSDVPIVVAGQRLVIAQSSQGIAVTPPTPAIVEPQVIMQALAWQSRRLDFESAPLPRMIAEINRYNQHKLVIADPRLATRRFGGSFPAGDHETFVRLLERNFNVVAHREADRTYLRLGP
jgi:transmembrane sensor